MCFAANEVMTVVQHLAADGVTLVATIHSPTAYAFSLFDSLMMLVRKTRRPIFILRSELIDLQFCVHSMPCQRLIEGVWEAGCVHAAAAGHVDRRGASRRQCPPCVGILAGGAWQALL